MATLVERLIAVCHEGELSELRMFLGDVESSS